MFFFLEAGAEVRQLFAVAGLVAVGEEGRVGGDLPVLGSECGGCVKGVAEASANDRVVGELVVLADGALERGGEVCCGGDVDPPERGLDAFDMQPGLGEVFVQRRR